MKIEWEPKVGPAAVVALCGSLSVLVTMGVVWGSTTARVDGVIKTGDESKAAISRLEDESRKRDIKQAEQNARLAGIDSSLSFIIPTMQRMEAKLDSVAKK